MNTPTNDGGPAFPGTSYIPGRGNCQPVALPDGQVEWQEMSPGMTLRDWFAGHETLADYDHPDAWNHYTALLEAFNGPKPEDKAKYFAWEFEARAKIKLARADAMIVAREVTK